MTETLEDHAKAWYRRQGIEPPTAIAPLWEIMYCCWVNYAFAGIGPNEYGITAGKAYYEAA